MDTSIRKFRVFIASPGDVARERQVARDVVLSLSQRLGSHGGFALEPVGWETHATLDVGRPQGLINPLVRTCDVFVGTLWSRFGTVTGVAESGTAEEFAEAEKLRKKTKARPTIMVFFSNAPVPMERLRDPRGRRQVTQAQKFRDRYEKTGGLAESYADVHEFERKLTAQLMEWCAQRFAVAPPPPPSAEAVTLRREYLQLLFNFHKDLPVAGFETPLRIPVDLERVLVPVRTRIAALDHRRTAARDLGPEPGAIDEAVRDFGAAWEFAGQRDIRLLVVLGQPGSGKTTLLKHLALVCAAERTGELGLTADTLPIFVPLRRLQTGGDFAAALQAGSEPSLRDFPPSFFAPALRDGRCLLLLDGLDEVADRKQRADVSRWIEELAARHAHNRIVVTARFAGYRDAPLRAGHLGLSIEPFREGEIEDFLRRWYRAVEACLHGDAAESAQRAEQVAATLSKAVLEHEQIRRLATNPLMLQIIALVHRDRGALPQRRVELYEECTNVLLEHWDCAKGLNAGLTAREARQVLQPVALWMHGETNRIHAPETEILSVVETHVRRLARRLDPQEFLRSVRDRSGLLTGHGVDEYGFQHLSFQEYLTAEEIRNTRAFESLAQHYDDSWWREVTRLLVGLDNPRCFDDFMDAVVRARKLPGHEPFTAECIRGALLPSVAPFIKALAAGDGSETQAYASLLAMRALPQAELASALDRLRPLARSGASAVRQLAGELLALAGAPAEVVADAGVDPDSGLPLLRINAIDRTEMVLIPGGAFNAGSNLDGDNRPREMTVPAFYLARYPVTNAQYTEFLKANPQASAPEYWDDERFNQPQQPVVGVNWAEAGAYCEWAGLRLPTEWEWEKGARGTDGRTYPWGEDEPDATRATFGDPSGQPTPVGSCPAGASPYGLFDMAGNVWEWSASRYRKSSPERTVRGGSFGSEPQFLRAAYRFFFPPVLRGDDVGFRCAQDP